MHSFPKVQSGILNRRGWWLLLRESQPPSGKWVEDVLCIMDQYLRLERSLNLSLAGACMLRHWGNLTSGPSLWQLHFASNAKQWGGLRRGTHDRGTRMVSSPPLHRVQVYISLHRPRITSSTWSFGDGDFGASWCLPDSSLSSCCFHRGCHLPSRPDRLCEATLLFSSSPSWTKATSTPWKSIRFPQRGTRVATLGETQGKIR